MQVIIHIIDVHYFLLYIMAEYNEWDPAGGDGSSFGREMGLNVSRVDEVSSDR